jgi:uncharacterized membrane protein
VIEKPSKTQPALLAGLVIGVLWSVPFLNLINLCCCLGVMAGGALAAWLLIKRSPVLPVSSGDGAVVGLLAGLVGAGVYLVLGVPIGLVFNQTGVSVVKAIFATLNNPEINRAMEEAIRNAQNQGLGERLLGALVGWGITSVISVGFSTIGGLIGVSMFEKRKGQQYPPQAPPGFPPGGPQRPGEAPYGASDPPY